MLESDKEEKIEDAVETMKQTLADGRECLEKSKDTIEREFTDHVHGIPEASSVTLAICETSALTSDT